MAIHSARCDVIVRSLDGPGGGFALRTTSSPDQLRFPTRESAVAHASAFARNAGGQVWFDHGPQGLELLPVVPQRSFSENSRARRARPRVKEAPVLPVLILILLIAGLPMAATGASPAASHGPVIPQATAVAAKDAYPNGCVDCHVAGKEGDMRISALLAKWTIAPSPALVEKARSASTDPAKIKGKHPSMANVKTNVPQTCLAACHKKGSTIAPPFAQLMHTIHLVGGLQNRFMSVNKGECTHCHKLDQKTGAWKMASGPEK
jgi:hypothetical protein